MDEKFALVAVLLVVGVGGLMILGENRGWFNLDSTTCKADAALWHQFETCLDRGCQIDDDRLMLLEQVRVVHNRFCYSQLKQLMPRDARVPARLPET